MGLIIVIAILIISLGLNIYFINTIRKLTAEMLIEQEKSEWERKLP